VVLVVLGEEPEQPFAEDGREEAGGVLRGDVEGAFRGGDLEAIRLRVRDEAVPYEFSGLIIGGGTMARHLK
jgi:hypothetical protein